MINSRFPHIGEKEKHANQLKSPPHTTDGNNCTFCWNKYTGVIDHCPNNHYGHMHVVQVSKKEGWVETLKQECDLCNPDLIIRV